MVTENGRAELRGLYTDPAQPLTIAVGQAFDLVSMPAAVGHAALSALRARRVRLGPVVADSRRSVMRVGFLVAPAHAPEGGVAGVRIPGGAVPLAGPTPAPGHAVVMRGDAEYLVGDAEYAVGDAEYLVGDAKYVVGDAKYVVGDAEYAVGHAESAALRDWAGRLGGALGVRVGGRGSTAILPPLVPWRGWLHWLVPPGGAAVLWTPAGALLSVLSVLSERAGARAL
jgi:hypothetical protein